MRDLLYVVADEHAAVGVGLEDEAEAAVAVLGQGPGCGATRSLTPPPATPNGRSSAAADGLLPQPSERKAYHAVNRA
jgi:hypothetical protein